MLNLPHKPPILFAHDIVSKDDNKVVVLVKFESIPTLAMMMEAAAQSSSAFCDKSNEGYIISCSNLALHSYPKGHTFNAHIVSTMQADILNEIHFEIKEDDVLISSGMILLMTKPSEK
jgi:hypothetical protein